MSAAPWASVPAPSPRHLADAPPGVRPLLLRLPEAAHAVVESGPNRGYPAFEIEPGFAHPPECPQAYDSHVLFAWFYTADRNWNPWRGHPALKARLEAVLAALLAMQTADGGFPGRSGGRSEAGTTATAACWLAETLLMLRQGLPIDPVIRYRALHAARDAILALLSGRLRDDASTARWEAVWPAALAFLAAFPCDRVLRLSLLDALQRTARQAQSPTGHILEAGGPDWGQSLRQHLRHMEHALLHARGTPWSPYFLARERRLSDWLAYNLVPDGDRGWSGNFAVATRSVVHISQAGLATNLAREIPILRALPTEAVPANGTAPPFNASSWLSQQLTPWSPTTQQRESARSLLPCHSREPFNHARRDPPRRATYLYLRRKSYYAAFNICASASAGQSFGLGLLWHPVVGTLLLSRRGSAAETWGTRGGREVYESHLPEADIAVNGKPIPEAAGAKDLPPGDLSVTYPLRAGQDRKTVTFRESGIHVEVRKAGAILEYLPLLLAPEAHVTLSGSGACLEFPGNNLRLRIDFPGAEASLRPTGIRQGGRSLTILELRAEGHLEYLLLPPDLGKLQAPRSGFAEKKRLAGPRRCYHEAWARPGM